MVIPGPDDESGSVGTDSSETRELIGWDLLFELHAMAGELRQTDGIVDVHLRTHEPVPNFTIETIEHGLGTVIPARIKSFYMVTDGLEFSWNYVLDGEKYPGGGAHLFDFATVFDTWLDLLWHGGEEHTDEQHDFFWSLRGFDRPRHTHDSDMVVMCVEEDYPTYDLFLHDVDTRESHLLELTFREYFDSLLACRATRGWRFVLSEDADRDDARAQRFFEITERFFPDVDLSGWG